MEDEESIERKARAVRTDDNFFQQIAWAWAWAFDVSRVYNRFLGSVVVNSRTKGFTNFVSDLT